MYGFLLRPDTIPKSYETWSVPLLTTHTIVLTDRIQDPESIHSA